jgi:hypothetical protein
MKFPVVNGLSSGGLGFRNTIYIEQTEMIMLPNLLTHIDNFYVDLGFTEAIDSSANKDPSVILGGGLDFQDLVIVPGHIAKPCVINLFAILRIKEKS